MKNLVCSTVRRKLLQKSIVTTCHQGYQAEINQIAGLLEIDKLRKNGQCYKGCYLALPKNAISLGAS